MIRCEARSMETPSINAIPSQQRPPLSPAVRDAATDQCDSRQRLSAPATSGGGLL